MTKRLLLARKYAQAYLNCFPSALTLADLPTLRRVQLFWQQQPALATSFTQGHFTPVVAHQLAALFTARFQLPVSCQKLFLILLQSGRLALCAAVFSELVLLYQQQHRQYCFQVSSVAPLTTLELQQLQRDLTALLVHKLQMSVTVELQAALAPTLLAGVKASNELFQWDGSLQGRLQRLAAKLTLVN